MGKLKTIILPGGRKVSVPEEDANAGTFPQETQEQATARVQADAREELNSGLVDKGITFAEGIADTVTGGGYGAAVNYLGGDEAGRNYSTRATVNPLTSTAGNIAGLVTGTGAVKLATGAGKAVAGATGSKAAGVFTEGFVLGAGEEVRSTNITGDRLTVSGILTTATIGGIFDVGLSKLGGKIVGAGKNAETRLAADKVLKETEDTALKGSEILAKNEGYASFHTAHKEATKAANVANNRVAEKAHLAEVADYEKVLGVDNGPRTLNAATGRLKKVADAVQADIDATPQVRARNEAQGKFKAAEADFTKQAEAYQKFATNGSDGWREATTQIDAFISEIERGGKASGARLENIKARGATGFASPMPKVDIGALRKQVTKAEAEAVAAERAARILGSGENAASAAAAARQKADDLAAKLDTATRPPEAAPPVEGPSPGGYDTSDTAKRVKEFRERRSKAAQKMAGYKAESGTWTPGGKTLADEAVAELKALREELAVAYPTRIVKGAKKGKGGLPEIPDPPAKPVYAEPSVDGPDTRESLAVVKREIDDTVARATDLASRRSYAEAADLINDLKTRLGENGYGHLDIPALPKRPGPKPTRVEPANDFLPDDAEELAKNAAAGRDITATLEEVRVLSSKRAYPEAAQAITSLKQRLGDAGFGHLDLPTFPDLPGPAVPVAKVDLPKNLAGFARMGDVKANALADTIDSLPPSVGDAFEAMARDLDLNLEGFANRGEMVRGVHAHLKKYPAALEALKAGKQASRKKGDGFFDRVYGFAKRGVQMAGGRHFDVGGAQGAVQRAIAGGTIGYAIDGTNGALIGAGAMVGRGALRQNIDGIVAKLGGPVGRGMQRMAPVTAVLGSRLFAGDDSPDPGDTRTQASNRLTDVHRASLNAPDVAYAALEDIMGAPDDLAFKLHQSIVGGINYLSQMAPKDPGIDVTLSGSKWRPSAEQAVAFAHRIEAVTDPLKAIERSIQGGGHPAATEALWTIHGALMEELATSYTANPAKMGYEAEARLAALLRLQTGLRNPAVLTTMQGMYLPPPETAQGASGSSPKASGRPAAVQSPVAGSSVSALTQ
jgi:hypothetical protein